MTNNIDDGLSDYERDKIGKQSLVLSAVGSHCSETSPFEDVRTIASALKSGKAKLAIENLSGGYTNYTYKIKLVPADDQDDSGTEVPCTALFVKLCFPVCFWNPEYEYDVQRVANECEMMQKFAELAPSSVATPYFLLDIDDMKLLATEWSSADEQMANQFIDGMVDTRVAKSMALAVATLHCSEIDPEFNTEARECMIDMFPRMEKELLRMARGEMNHSFNRVSKLAEELGPEILSAMFDQARESYRERAIPAHTDLHMFNVLVEGKPDANKLEMFGEKGSFCICDWEMCMAGPLGLDMGRLYSIPVACLLAHAISGNFGVKDGILEWLDLYWEEYSSAMKRLGAKDEDFLRKSYRNALAWLGWKLFAICTFDWFVPFLPIESSDVDMFKESLGMVGITLMRSGFGGYEEELSLDELRLRLNATITDEVAVIKMKRRGGNARRRRSSVLRKTNRRVSDAFQGMRPESLRNVIAEVGEGASRGASMVW